MAIVIENRNNLDFISSDDDDDDNIDYLILKNNLYRDDIKLKIGYINKLKIINHVNYVTDVYSKIIDKVVNNGKLILTNVIMKKLDCSRFTKVKLNNCIIIEIISDNCEVIYDDKSFKPRELLHGKLSYSNGIYNGEYHIVDYRLIRHGEGIMKYADGGEYNGNWIEDIRFGYGTMKYSNGSIYEGQWKYDERYGYGTMKYVYGSVYNGEWSGDRSGYGTMKYTDGSVYYGRWMEDKRSGRGTMKYIDGGVYSGSWMEDKRSGYGTMKYADGSVYNGRWMEDIIFQL